jgi:FkbM family methyltransferase
MGRNHLRHCREGSDALITFEYEDTVVRFDDSGLDRNNPGLIHAELLHGRFYEEQFLRYVHSLDLRGCYVDVGAHVGTHTVFFAKICNSERVHAFEPLPSAFKRLQANVRLNDVADRVVLHQLALTSQTCDVVLTRGRHTSLVPTPRQGELPANTHVVPGRRLDDLVRDHVVLIKIDVEGMEPAVLDGARRLIRQSRPVIFAEAATAREHAAVCRVLRPLGYVPTGRRFNSTPTYEFVHAANPLTRWTHNTRARLWRLADSPSGRRAKRLLPSSLRRRLRR